MASGQIHRRLKGDRSPSVQAHLGALCDFVSNGGTLAAAGPLLALSAPRVIQLWKMVRDDLGAQAS